MLWSGLPGDKGDLGLRLPNSLSPDVVATLVCVHQMFLSACTWTHTTHTHTPIRTLMHTHTHTHSHAHSHFSHTFTLTCTHHTCTHSHPHRNVHTPHAPTPPHVCMHAKPPTCSHVHATHAYSHVPPCSHTHIGTHVRTEPTKAASCIPAAWPAQLAETQQCKSAQSRHSWEDVGRGPSLSQAYSQGMKMSSSCLACVPQGLTETKGVLSKGNWGC